ncbi:MAG: TIGR02147 family protein [Fibrobacteria bacterium]
MPKPEKFADVFSFVDYRQFLKEYYKSRKAFDPGFSHRFIASQIRATSTGWFSDLVNGRTNISGNHLIKLVQLLDLSGAEAEYFTILVQYDQAGTLEGKTQLYRKLFAIKGVRPELVGKDRFEFYSEWYHAVIRELLFFHDFNGDPSTLAKILHPPISVTEAKKSLRLLEGLGFIRKGPAGTYKSLPATLKKDPAFKSLHLDSYFKSNIRLGAESLETIAKEERDISTMTLPLSKSGFEKAKEEIRALRNRLLALTQSDTSPEKVYHCNFHIFPVTR